MMSNPVFRVMMLMLAAGLLWLPRAVAQEPPAPVSQIEVDADRLDYDRAAGRITAIGNVVVISGVDELRADRVLVNINTGDAYALNNVVLRRGGQTVEGDKLHYNFQTRVSSMDRPTIEADPFRLVAERVTRSDQDAFELEGVKLTTCIYDHPHAHYHLRARRATVIPNERVITRGAVWYFGRVPCFYFPYWNHNLDEDSGFRFYPGYRSRWGAYLLSSYRHRPLPWLKLIHQLDYRTKRGVAVGEDLLWSPEYGKGDLSLYYLDDTEPMPPNSPPDSPVIDSERYRLRLRHQHQLEPQTQFKLQANYLSDPLVLRDYFDREYRRSRQPENYATLSRRYEHFTLTAEANLRLNDFYGNVNRLPEIRLNVFRQQLGGSSFYYESRTAAAFLERVFPEEPAGEDYSSLRVDTEHVLYQPRQVDGWLNLVPRAGYRATGYADALTPQTTGEDTNRVTVAVDAGEATLRHVFEIGSEVSFKAFKRLPDSGGQAWRHVVEPYADWSLRLEPNVLPAELYQFDATDQLDELHQILVGVRNKLQTKREGRSFDVVDVDTFATLKLNAEGEERMLDLLFLDSRFRPADWLTIRIDGAYSAEERELKVLNTRVLLNRKDVGQLEVEHRFRQEQSSLVAASATYRLNRGWSVNGFGRYEFETSRAEEVGGYVERMLDCMGIRVGGSMLPGFTRTDGSEQEADYRLMLEIWLTAFPELSVGSRHR